MKRLGVPALAVCCALGCSATSLTAYREALPAATASPSALDVTRVLPSATEADWRRETDIGNVRFDEEGMPLTEKKGQKQNLVAVKPAGGRIALRMGMSAGLETNNGDDYLEVNTEGPVIGASFLLGSRTGRVAFEIGVDYSEASGRYLDNAGNEDATFDSGFVIGRGEVLVYVNGARSKFRLYAAAGGRFGTEQTDIRREEYEGSYTNSGTGFSFALGMKTGRFDFRVERAELGGENGFALTNFTAAMSF